MLKNLKKIFDKKIKKISIEKDEIKKELSTQQKDCDNIDKIQDLENEMKTDSKLNDHKKVKKKNKKKLTRKQKIIKRSLLCSLAVLLCFVIGSVCFLFLGGNDVPAQAGETNATTTIKPLPINSNPSKETDLDNIAYLAYKIQTSRNFKSVSNGQATSKVMGIPYVQTIVDYRSVSDEYMFQKTISTSSMVSFALEKFYFDDKIIRREGSPNGQTDANWAETPKDAITYKLADQLYGWTPNQISAYILCEESILTTERLANGENGFYEIKLVLDPSVAPYKYQRQVKEFAGSNSYPGFSKIELTYKFDSQWNIISTHTEEIYGISMFGMNLTISTDINEEFTYEDEVEIPEVDYYEAYRNMPAIGEVDDKIISAQELFLQGFSNLLNGNLEKYQIDLIINERRFNIIANIEMASNTYLISINDEIFIKADLNNTNSVYINYKDLHLKYELSDNEKMINLIGIILDGINISNNQKTSIKLDINSIMQALLSAPVEIDDVNNTAVINTILPLGIIDLPIQFSFIKNTDTYIFNSIISDVEIETNKIKLSVNNTSQIVLFEEANHYQNLGYLSFILEDIAKLLNAKAISFEGDIKIPLNEKTTNVNLDGIYDPISKRLKIAFTSDYMEGLNFDLYYQDGYIYLVKNELNLKFEINRLNEIIEIIKNNKNSEQEQASEDLLLILSILKDIKLDETISSIVITENSLDFTVYTINSAYSASIFNEDNNLVLNLMDLVKLTLTPTNSNDFAIPETSTDVSDLVVLIKYFLANKDAKAYDINLNFDLNYNDMIMTFSGHAYFDINLNLKFTGYVEAEGVKIPLDIILKDSKLYVTVLEKSFMFKINEIFNYLPQINIDLVTSVLALLVVSPSILNNTLTLSLNDINWNNINISNINMEINPTDLKVIDGIPSDYYELNDLKNLVNIVQEIIEIFKNEKLSINFKTLINYKNNNYPIEINGIYDQTKKSFSLEVKIGINDTTLIINLSYSDKLYFSFKNINIALTSEELKEISNRYNLNKELYSQFDQIISIMSNMILTIYQNGIDAKLDLSSIISAIGIMAVNLNVEDGHLYLSASNIEVNGIILTDIGASLASTNLNVNIPDKDYLSYDQIRPILDIIDNSVNIITSKQVMVELDTIIVINNTTLLLQIRGIIDFKDGLKTHLNVKVIAQSSEINLNISYDGKYFYFSYENINLKLTLLELKEIVTRYKKSSLINQGIYNILEMLDRIQIDSINNRIDIIVNLAKITDLIEEIVLSVNSDNGNLLINISDLEVSNVIIKNIFVKLGKTNLNVEVEDKKYLTYNDILPILEIADTILQLINNQQVSLEFKSKILINEEIAEISVSGVLDFSTDYKLNLDINMLYNDSNISFNLMYVDNYFYLTSNYINIKLNFDEINQIISKVSAKTVEANNISLVIEILKTIKINLESGVSISLNLALISSLLDIITITIHETANGVALEIANLSIGKIELKDLDFFIEKSNQEIKIKDVNYLTYNEILPMIDIINYGIQLFENGKVWIDLNTDICLDDFKASININGLIEFKDSLQFNLNISILTNNKSTTVRLDYDGTYFYLTMNDLKVKLKLAEIKEIVSHYISESYFINENIDIILMLLNSLNITIQDGFLSILINLKNITDLINQLQFKLNLTETGLNVEISDLNIYNLQILPISIKVKETNLNVYIKEDTYLNFEDILPILDIIDHVLNFVKNESTYISLDTVIKYNNLSINLSINGSINFQNNFMFDFDIKAYLMEEVLNINLLYDGLYLYISYEKLNFKLTIPEINNMISEFVQIPNLASSFDLNTLITLLESIKLTSEQNIVTILFDLSAITTKLNKLKLSIQKIDNILELNIFDFTIDNLSITDTKIRLSDTSETVKIPDKDYLTYNDLKPVISLAKEVLSYLKSQKVAIDLSFKLNTFNESFDIRVLGIVDFSADICLDFDIEVLYKDTKFIASISYENEHFYFKLNQIQVCLTFDEIIEIINHYRSQSYNIDDLTILSILKTIDLKVQNNVINISINLGQLTDLIDEITFNIEEVNGKINVTTNNLKIFNIELTNLNIDIKKTSEEITINPNDKYLIYDDIIVLLDIVDYIVDVIKTNKTYLNINSTIQVNDKKVDFNLNGSIDFTNQLKLSVLVNLKYEGKSIDISIYYADGFLYLNYEKLSIKLTINEINELLGNQNNLFKSNNTLALIKEILESLILNRIDNVIKISLDLISMSSLISELNLELALSEDGLNVDISTLEFDGISLTNTTLKFNANAEEIIIPDNNYLTYDDLLPILDVVKTFVSTIKSGQIEIDLTFILNLYDEDVEVNINGIIDFRNNLKLALDIKLNIDEGLINAKLVFDGVYFYLSFNNINVKLSYSEIKNILGHYQLELTNNINFDLGVILSLLKTLELSVENKIININLDLNQISASLGNLIISLEVINEKLVFKAADLIFNKFHFSQLELNINKSLNEVQIKDVNYLTYNDILILLDMVDYFIATVNEGKVNINFETEIFINQKRFKLDLNAILNFQEAIIFNSCIKISYGNININLNISYDQTYFYVSIADINLKLTLSELNEIIHRYTTYNLEIGNTSVSLKQLISVISTINLERILNGFYISFDLSYITELVKDYNITLSYTDKLEIILGTININSLLITSRKITAQKTEQIVEIPDNRYLTYTDVVETLDIIDYVLMALNDGSIAFDFNTNIYLQEVELNVSISGNIEIKNSLMFSVNISTIYKNQLFDLVISYDGLYFYLNYEQLNFKLTMAEINQLINNFTELPSNSLNIDLVKILEIFKNLKIVSQDNSIIIIVNLGSITNLLDKVKLTFVKSTKGIDISISNLEIKDIKLNNIKLSIYNTNELIVIPTQDYLTYDSLLPIVDIIKELIDTIKARQIEFNLAFNTIYNNEIIKIYLNGIIDFRNQLEFALDINIILRDKLINFDIIYDSNYFYFMFNDINIKLNYFEIIEILERYSISLNGSNNFDLNIIVNLLKSFNVRVDDQVVSMNVNLSGVTNLIKNISLSFELINFKLVGGICDLNINDIKINKIEFNVDKTVSVVEIKDCDYLTYTDILNVLDIVDFTSDIIKNGIIEVKFNTKILFKNQIISLDVAAIIDIRNQIIFNVDMKILYLNSVIDIDLAYDGTHVYINIGNIHTKLTWVEVKEIISNYQSESLNLNDSSLALEKVLSIIYSMKIKRVSNGFSLSCDLNSIISSINTYTIEIVYTDYISIKLDDLNLSSVNITNSNVVLNKTVEPVRIRDEAYLSFEQLKPFIELPAYFINLIKNGQIQINLNTTIIYQNEEVNLNLIGVINFDKKLLIDLNVSLGYRGENISLNILYDGTYFYLNYANLHIKLTIDEIMTIIQRYQAVKFDNVAAGNVGISANQIIEFFKNIQLVSNGDVTRIIFDFRMFTNLIETVTLDIKYMDSNLILTISDINALDVKLSNINVELSINSKQIEIPDNNYIDYVGIEMILSVIDEVIEMYENKTFHVELAFDTKLNGLNIGTNFSLDINLNTFDINGEIALEIVKTIHKVKFAYSKEYIYLSYGEIAIKLHVSEIEQLVNFIKQKWSLTTSQEYSLKETSATLSQILEVIESLKISHNNNALDVVLSLSSVVQGLSDFNVIIKVINENLVILSPNITYSGFTLTDISAYLSGNVSSFEIPNMNYLNFEQVKEIISYSRDIFDLFNEKRYNFSFTTEIINNGSARFKADAKALLEINQDNSFNLQISVDIIALTDKDKNYTLDIIIKDGYAYLNIKLATRDDVNHDFLKITCSMNDLLEIIATITSNLGIEVPLLDQFITKTYNFALFRTSNYSIIDNISAIVFSDYVKSIALINNALRLVLDGNKIFGASDDLEIFIGKSANSQKVDYFEIYNIYSYNTVSRVEKFNITLILTYEDFIIETPDTSEYIDISTINDLLQTAFNTSTLTDFNITGSANVKMTVIGININMNINYQFLLKLDENNIPTIMIKFTNIPVIPGVNNDVPYKFGDVDGGSNRELTIYIQNALTYIYRHEYIATLTGSKSYEKKLMTSNDAFVGNIMDYLLKYGFGFSDSIMNAIYEGLKIDPNHVMDLAKLVNNYSKNEDDTYNLSISLYQLTGNSQLGDISLTLSTSEEQGMTMITNVSLGLDINVSVLSLTISTSDTKLNNVGQSVDLTNLYTYINEYKYNIDEAWEARDGNWTKASEILFKLTIVKNDGSENLVKELRQNENIELPKFDTYKLINGVYYQFAGWYTTEDFVSGSEFNEELMPRYDITVYAKWILADTGTIYFETEFGKKPEPIYQIVGTELTLPSMEIYSDGDITYRFVGWKCNGELFNLSTMPKGELLLVAIWEVVKTYVIVDDDYIEFIPNDEIFMEGEWINASHDASYYEIYRNTTGKDLAKMINDTLIFDEDLLAYVFNVKLYHLNRMNDLFKVIYNVNEKFSQNEKIVGHAYKKGTAALSSNIPDYMYDSYEVNAWFSDSSLSNIVDVNYIENDIILYPYYSTKAEFFNYNQNVITGITNSFTTIILPIYNQEFIIVDTVGTSAFLGNGVIETVIMSKFITTLQQDAFKNTTKLVNVYLSDTMTANTVATDAFYMANSSRANEINFYGNGSIDFSKLLAYKGGLFNQKKYYYNSLNKTLTKYDLVSIINKYIGI